ncbi:MAG: serine hydrolase domain-containing protein [Dehalococcoidia bacterium]
MPDINAKVLELLKRQIAEGTQLGVQVAAYQHGKPVVDVCAGTMGPGDSRTIQPDSLVSCFSTTKGVAAVLVHILADQGVIDYDAPVAKYWRAFAQNGKAAITVAQAMSHQAGLMTPRLPNSVEALIDWDANLKYIEEKAPEWEPGTATGYHGLTYAWICGGIIQHATGRDPKELVVELIARPLGIEGELYIGIPDDLDPARLTELNDYTVDVNTLPEGHLARRFGQRGNAGRFNDIRVRRACLPSVNGHFSARALAKMYGALANGGEVDGARLVSAERIAAIQKVYCELPDRALMDNIPKGVGLWMGGSLVTSIFGPRRTAFGHSGLGGSTAFADPEYGLSIAVTNNQLQMVLQGEGPTMAIANLIRSELGVPAH